MRAVVITEPGAPSVLRVREVPDPEPGPGEVRVRVEAAGVNRADLLQRQGRYAAPEGYPADIPGLEYAGVVDAVGDRVSLWSGGERVMGLVGGGGYAEYVVAGLTGGRTATLDLGVLLRKRLTVIGTVLRSRSGPERVAAARAFAEQGLPLIARGAARPVIHEVLPMTDVIRAHELLESNQTFGSVVLSW